MQCSKSLLLEKTLELLTRSWWRRGLVTISIHCWGLVRYELFSVWAHLALFKLRKENHSLIQTFLFIHSEHTINDCRTAKTPTCALRAAACWIWLLLRALLKGSLSSRVFLCTISRGFLKMASSSLTPVPRENHSLILTNAHHWWLAFVL